MMQIIRCRAHVSDECKDGHIATLAAGDPDFRIEEDGTYREDGTIVCNPCYLALMPLTPSGQGLTDELPRAIMLAREIRSPMPERVQRFVDETNRAGYTPGVEETEGGLLLTASRRDTGEAVDVFLIKEGELPERVGGVDD